MINPRYNRQKGKAGEREVAELMSRLSGVKYRRVPSSGALHGYLDYDLMKENRSQPSVFDGVGNEVKNTKKLTVPQWIQQIEVACEDAGNSQRWFIAMKHRGKWYFMLNEQYFSELVEARKLSTG